MSIPGKWEAKLRIEAKEQSPSKRSAKTPRGFGMTSSRFDNSHINDRPGPGYYDRDIDPGNSSLFLRSPSLSRKGFRNAFVSKSPKQSVYNKEKLDLPGPGHYVLNEESRLRNNCGSCFRGSSGGRVPFPLGPMTPGALEYHPNENPGVPILLKNKVSATFCSSSKRDSFFKSFSDAPGVGRYDPMPDLSPTRKADITWGMKKSERFSDCYEETDVPGPGAYFQEKKEEEEDLQESSGRTAGAYKGKYLGKQNASPIANQHTFGADIFRFKHSFMGRLDEECLKPGPGAYEVTTADKVLENDVARQFTFMFRSASPNRIDFVKVPSERTPGPAYYRPHVVERKALSQNLDGKWV